MMFGEELLVSIGGWDVVGFGAKVRWEIGGLRFARDSCGGGRGVGLMLGGLGGFSRCFS